MLWLLYFGRLEKEKWFDAIIEMILRFGEDGDELPFELFVFGAWSYEKEIQELAHRYKTIHFFGRQDLETIRRYTSNCNFLLMPSTCLESFGLIALTGLARGLPTIGFAKGGTAPFIDPALDLGKTNGQTLPEKLFYLIHRLGQEDFFTGSLPVSDILKEYSNENRKANIAYQIGEKKRILIVSDFTNRIWWLETYINDAKDILISMGYEVEMFGVRIPKGFRGKIIKYLGFVTAIFNIIASIKLRIKIKKIKPEIIWYHSILRYLGRLPLRISKWSKAEKRMMYHDLGYFFPYPSKLQNEAQIRYPLTLKNFISSAQTKNPIKILAMTGKYFLLQLIKKQLQKRIKLHLVPSTFMKPIVHRSYDIADEKIVVFPHFIQE